MAITWIMDTSNSIMCYVVFMEIIYSDFYIYD